MRKFLFFTLSILAILVITACGTDTTSTDEEKEEDKPVVETAAKEEDDNNKVDTSVEIPKGDENTHEPIEPTEDTVCAICNMKVYGKDHEMGVFSGQGIIQDGKTVFFDDVGCIMNYDNAKGSALQTQWVRDYETLEWTETSEAIPVKTDLKSPMKWGYVFFDSEEKAEKFIEENGDLNPAIADWKEIDTMAAERYQKKMDAMKQQEGSDQMHHNEDGHNHDHDHNEEHHSEDNTGMNNH